ncbi:hypothetical protein BU26DRAFT_352159 [Trematosphaeria pertusa]|uniref:Uncharacterized protein n=1 Tax=Trematosphaeria pertusa TaxID=390896 RepID=A0A6A6IDX4_9PLEO|nr:uncharacterized protein BU26DRAFT_352159 [Trematosphaeria pertusa]KAF2247703.1 hypothetical protein BU26DRAFT_352159 [Trematosphaeria pertusa]
MPLYLNYTFGVGLPYRLRAGCAFARDVLEQYVDGNCEAQERRVVVRAAPLAGRRWHA